jgi:hypothetical protein
MVKFFHKNDEKNPEKNKTITKFGEKTTPNQKTKIKNFITYRQLVNFGW